MKEEELGINKYNQDIVQKKLRECILFTHKINFCGNQILSFIKLLKIIEKFQIKQIIMKFWQNYLIFHLITIIMSKIQILIQKEDLLEENIAEVKEELFQRCQLNRKIVKINNYHSDPKKINFIFIIEQTFYQMIVKIQE